MLAKGLKAAPALQIDDEEIMDFSAAVRWLQTKEKEARGE